MWPLVLLIAFGIAWIVQFHYKRHTYFKKIGLPGPPYGFLLGNSGELFNGSPPLIIQDWSEQYGETYGMYEGSTPVVVSSDLDLVHEIFVKRFDHFHGHKPFPLEPDPEHSEKTHVFLSRGLRWKRMRSITNPAFAVSKLKKVMPIIDECTDPLLDKLEANSQHGKPFNIHPLLQEFTLDVIAHIAFGEERMFQKGKPEDNPYLDLVRKIFGKPESAITMLIALISVVYPEANRFSQFLFEKIGTDPGFVLEQKLDALVEERRKMKDYKGRTDFIQLFLEAEAGEDDAEGLGLGSGNDTELNLRGLTYKKKLTAGEITMNLLLFLLAGYDTTSNTLAYAIYLMAINPETQQKAYEEVTSVFGSVDEICYDKLNELTYVEAVIKESLRLFPHAAIATTRRCMEPCEVRGIKFERGVCFVADLFTMHRSRKVWGHDAHEFKPERFLDGTVRHPMAWMPFGNGPRICQGMRLAYAEIKIVLAKILFLYDLRQCDETMVPLKISGVSTLAPAHVTVTAIKRDS